MSTVSDQSRVRDLLKVDFPLIQSGMGGIATPELASAVLKEGCAGVVALYKNAPSEIADDLTRMRAMTGSLFGVNLIPEIVEESYLISQIRSVLDFEDVYFTFYGLPPADAARLVTENGRVMIIMVGTPEEAVAAKELGSHAIVLQGIEAGGHLLGDLTAEQLYGKVKALDLNLPLLVSGGASTGRAFHKYTSLGFEGALCGTMFVTALESNAHDVYKEKISRAKSRDTVITYRFDVGWPDRKHRVLGSELTDPDKTFTKSFIARIEVAGNAYAVPRYSSVVPTRQTRGKVEEMVMYCGESCDFVNEVRPVSTILGEYRAQYNTLREQE